MILAENVEIKYLAECREHIPQLAILWYEGISKHWVPSASIERAQQNLNKHLNDEKMPLTLVVLYDGKPIGMASLRENDGICPDLIPWLGSLVIDHAYRGQGMGNKLIKAVKNQAKNFGYEKLYLLAFDKTIPSWYKQLGWKEIGTNKLFEHSVTVMCIDL